MAASTSPSWPAISRKLRASSTSAASSRGAWKICPLQGAQPVVDARIDIDHLAMAVEQVDGGQEARPLQAILVELVGHDIGGGHQHHAMLEERLELEIGRASCRERA